MLELSGIPVSDGVAIAKAYCLVEPDLSVEKLEIRDVEKEKERLKDAIQKAKLELEEIRETAKAKFGEEKATIFSAQILVLQDPDMLFAIENNINDGVNAEFAVHEVVSEYVSMFKAMESEYMQERAIDIQDVAKRLLAHLLGREILDYSRLSTEVIIVAEDLTPSMTTQLDKKYVKGFITNIGGRTSHSAILARTMGIPAIVGAKTATKDITHGSSVIMDGTSGKIILDASEELKKYYVSSQRALEKENELLAQYISLPSVSFDGHPVEIAGNIGKPGDVAAIIANGGDGIGLFRTEFLYMDRKELPDEEEQFLAYKTVLEKMENKPTIVRTLDIGGDKELPYLNLEKEMNPFLGYRAIRLCLDQQHLFRTQLRALLRASVHGNLKIMFPMIATLDEFRAAKELLGEEKEWLINNGFPVSEQIEVGMMVEIPSAAVIADLFAKEADFLSIGTNDLIQYTFAADRMNEKVSYLYQPYHPAILRLVKMVIDAAHSNGKWVGMCGEMAGDEIAIPILLALGLDEFSMNASSILKTRALIARLPKEQLAVHVENLLIFTEGSEVKQYVEQNLLL
ncbi:phosphoenolpyruvate--protein phosphotransferase [Bacillus sp. FJAT-22090]|uniref:phosphoenolpyruvate--protein phosphotransferase n=1 Tax=Bacillus sp. FJAT-22090 TaxID=1581038 RepID=UPI0011A92688|nr:phosphoenolpyruvate--protein phosphotransferase [Bacillus sp. FJAT-22090]